MTSSNAESTTRHSENYRIAVHFLFRAKTLRGMNVRAMSLILDP